MEGEAAVGGEDGHGVGEAVERIVVGGDGALQGLAGVLRLGDVESEGAGPATLQGPRVHQKGAAATVHRHPAQGLAAAACAGGLGGGGLGAAVETEGAVLRLLQAGGVDGGEPSVVRPGGPPVALRQPDRRRQGVEEGGEARRARQALTHGGGEPKPRQGAGDATLHRHAGAMGLAALAASLESEGLALIYEGVEPPRVLGLVVRQGGDHGRGRDVGGQAEGQGAPAERVGAADQLRRPFAQADQRRVEHLGRSPRRFRFAHGGVRGGGVAPDAGVGRPPLPKRQQGGGEREAHRAGGGDQGGIKRHAAARLSERIESLSDLSAPASLSAQADHTRRFRAT